MVFGIWHDKDVDFRTGFSHHQVGLSHLQRGSWMPRSLQKSLRWCFPLGAVGYVWAYLLLLGCDLVFVTGHQALWTAFLFTTSFWWSQNSPWFPPTKLVCGLFSLLSLSSPDSDGRCRQWLWVCKEFFQAVLLLLVRKKQLPKTLCQRCCNSALPESGIGIVTPKCVACHPTQTVEELQLLKENPNSHIQVQNPCLCPKASG